MDGKFERGWENWWEDKWENKWEDRWTVNEKPGGKTSGKMGESCLLFNWRGGTTGRRRTGGRTDEGVEMRSFHS